MNSEITDQIIFIVAFAIIAVVALILCTGGDE